MIPKFRAWHTEYKAMRNVKLITWLEDGHIGLHLEYMPDGRGQFYLHENIELMQWTGLQDKNGKDIYADDLIEYNDKIYIVPSVTPVSRHHDAECVNGYKEICDDWTSWSNDCYEIIGNIYSNPELNE